MNDIEITATQPAVVELILAVASGRMQEDKITEWLAANTAPYVDDEE